MHDAVYGLYLEVVKRSFECLWLWLYWQVGVFLHLCPATDDFFKTQHRQTVLV